MEQIRPRNETAPSTHGAGARYLVRLSRYPERTLDPRPARRAWSVILAIARWAAGRGKRKAA